MYKITKQFSFEASHQLSGLPEGHKCARLHGHSYQVVVELCADTLDDRGFVLDYGDLDPIKDYIAVALDHQHLNNIIEQPTAENLARMLYNLFKPDFPMLLSVMVKETEKTSATYTTAIR
jgi:6-pyruvoyltetrahydropterin/6-carboxytetrahydropterin synthase